MDDNNNSNSSSDNNSISNEERQRQEIKNLLSKPSSSTSSPVKVNSNNNIHIANRANNSNINTTTTTPNTTPINNNNNNNNNNINTTKVPVTTTATTINNTNTNNINTTQPQVPLREDKLKLAVSFLTSPKVQTADKSKKTAFLKQKGLTDQEIEEAYKRADGSSSTITTTQNINKVPTSNSNVIQSQSQQSTYSPSSTTSNLAPIIPSRPPVTRPTQVVYYSAADPERLSVKKMIGLALFFGIGAVGLTSSLLTVVKKCISPIFKSIYQYQSNRYNDRQHKITRLNNILNEQWKESEVHSNDDLDDDINLEKENHGWWSPILVEQKDLIERLDKVIQYSKKYIDEEEEPYGKLKNVLLDFKDVITKPEYNYTSYTPYSVYGSGFNNKSNTGFDDDAVQGIKSEIRSLKGTLLSRRNFPKAQIKPSVFSTITSSSTSSSTNTTPSTTPPPPSSPSSSSPVTTDKIVDTKSMTTIDTTNINIDNDKNKKEENSSLNTTKEIVSSPTSSTSSQAYHPRQREPQSFRAELRNKALEATNTESSSSSSSSSTPVTEQVSTDIKGKGKKSVTVEEIKEPNDN
ncbi:unnamed protein product [Cunninghamella blakesleeana]